MNVKTFLITNPEYFVGIKPTGNYLHDKPDRITGKDVGTLIALDTKDGFVKMSMETWKRLEIFIGILQAASFDCDLARCEPDIQKRFKELLLQI